jgi:lysophospholipase L1-like esterase
MNMVRLAWALAAATFATACAVAAPAPNGGPAWIGSWGASPLPPTPAGGFFPASPSFSNVTLRQVVRLSAGGDQLRVRLTNEYGAAPLSIGAASIALVDASGAVAPGAAIPLTFGGAASATVPAGSPLLSDAVDLATDDLAHVSISLYLPADTGPCTCHQVALEEGYVSPPGDYTSAAFTPAETLQQRAFLSGVEVAPAGSGAAIVALGDSITDGVGATAGANRRWPDLLADRLAARGQGAWGVVNHGVSGNRVLANGAGESALARLDRDVLSVSGARYLIVFEGVNDLGISFGNFSFPGAPAGPPPLRVTAEEMIAGYRQIIARAHAEGLEVFGATIAPYEGAAYWSPEGEAARQTINAWIRDGGEFDAVLDFDAALADPAQPSRMAEGLHSGDFLHGSDAGYAAMAESIDVGLFE